jgi:hypothetical protein
MKGSRLLNLVFTLIVLLALSVGWAQAQERNAGKEAQPQVGDATAAILEDAIPIQGRLTDASGVPLSGDHSVTFSLYDDLVAGTLLCSTNYNPLPMSNGLFNITVTGCDNTEIDGDQLYLGVQVDADAEMTPRQPIYAVPYARSLRPGADIRGDLAAGSVLALYNSSIWDGSKGLYAEALGVSGITYGVLGRSNSPAGYGGYFYNDGAAGVGLFARAGNDDAPDLVLGGNSSIDDNGRIDSDPGYPGSDLLLVSNDRFHIHLDNNNDENNSDFSILNGSNNTVLTAEENGRLNLGINAGAAMTITVGDRYRDNAIVAWAKITGGVPGSIQAEFGISAVDHYATGCFKIYLDIAAANSASLIPMAIAEIDTAPVGAGAIRIVSINQVAVNIFNVYINDGNGNLVDNDLIFMVTAR